MIFNDVNQDMFDFNIMTNLLSDVTGMGYNIGGDFRVDRCK